VPGELILRPSDVPPGRWPMLVFKALQLLQVRSLGNRLLDYVAFDLETTDIDVNTCEVVELAGVRVRNGEVVAQFRELVRCTRGTLSPSLAPIPGFRR
jgi:DNA polymerase III epsilon subunit-like protein